MNADTFLAYTSAILSMALATGAAFRARRSPARWAFVAGMILFTAERVLQGIQSQSTSMADRLQGQTWQLACTALLPSIWLFFSLSYARGNASHFPKQWGWILTLALGLPLIGVSLFRQQLILSVNVIERSSSLVFILGWAGLILQIFLLISAVLILMNLERTYRASVGTVRWRIKFMLMGVALLFIVRLFTASQALLFNGMVSSLDSLHSGALILAGLLMLRSLFRAGHFELDVYPSDSVLRSSATVFIAGVYLVFVGVFAKIVTYLGGDSAFSFKALLGLVALVGLAVLLQSDRVQLNLRHFISRHFQRPLHDYQSIWHQFAQGTAAQVGQTEYCRAIVKLLADIFQALSITLLIVEERREELVLVASSSVSGHHAAEAVPNANEAAAIIHHLSHNPDPREIEFLPDDWAAALRRCHPDEFHKGSRRICLPIVSGGKLQAVILLGDRVGGTNFATQDLDLLKSIGTHISSGLMNVRLAQRLLQTREHEAFQAMATFFVHDLKNAATTLNLMLTNLPDHFDDPAFREDALRGVGKSVAHINNLISRLSQLRQESKFQTTPTHLNGIINNVLGGLENIAEIQVKKQLAELPLVPVDQTQIGKVVTNLMLNAREAMGARGQLDIATSQKGGWAIISVTDTGCGMTPEFIAQSLFRPFQTTKKNGLGIGMFQSKMIVEAHGGRFSVESAPGKGTTFRVFLPLRPTHN